MSDKLHETIHQFLVEKALAQPSNSSLADELASQLKEQSPGWDWGLWRSAKINPGFCIAIIGVIVTGIMVAVTTNEMVLTNNCNNQKSSNILAAIIVVFWLIGPPIYFFFELYFRGVNKEAREMIESYQQAAQRIWLAVAAVLIALYGLSFKV